MGQARLWRWGESGRPGEDLLSSVEQAGGCDLWTAEAGGSFTKILDDLRPLQELMQVCLEVALPIWEESIHYLPEMRQLVEARRRWLAGEAIDPEVAFDLWSQAEVLVGTQDMASFGRSAAAGWVIVDGGELNDQRLPARLSGVRQEFRRMCGALPGRFWQVHPDAATRWPELAWLFRGEASGEPTGPEPTGVLSREQAMQAADEFLRRTLAALLLRALRNDPPTSPVIESARAELIHLSCRE